VTDQTTMLDLLADQMADPETQWSLGTFGAIAEFARDADEPGSLSRTDRAVRAVTDRGGICIEAVAGLRPAASETAVGNGWNHRLALCLPEARCEMSRRIVLTEVGLDAAALRAADRNSVLFDLGLGCRQVDVCVRTSDRELIGRLRAQAGRALFEPGNAAMAAIFASSPHRVFIARLGRIEVFQPIPASGGESPTGPHTHVLPKLLALRRTHAATEPIPAGFVPCGHLYPPHPSKDAHGRARPFDADRHKAFQTMLNAFGDPELVALKRKVVAAVEAGDGPSTVSVPNNRFARGAVRVALCQVQAGGGSPPALTAWLAAHIGTGRHDAAQEQAATRGR
jgi:hypothetical protein